MAHPDPALSAYFAEDEAVERLVQALALAEGYHLQIVLCNSQYVCRALIAEVESRVASLRGEPVSSRVWDLFEGLSDDSIRSGEHIERLLERLIQTHADRPDTLLCYVDGSGPRPVGARAWKGLFERLNQRRDVIARYVAAPLTLLLPEHVVGLLTESAPDLWSSRSAQVVMAPPAAALATAGAFRPTPSMNEPRSSEVSRAASADPSLEAALEDSRREVEASPGDAHALHRFVILLERAAEQSANSGKFERAVSLLAEAVSAARKRVELTAGGGGERASSPRADPQPSDPLPALATVLDRLGALLLDLGRREKALEATREAIEIRRQLVLARADAFLPDLALSLFNLGTLLSDLGQKEAALEATREAVESFRQLAQAKPEAFLPYLAGGLNNLALYLASLGLSEAALEVSREAVERYRQLAAARPDAFLLGLVGSLSNLSNASNRLGHRQAALDATREAAEKLLQHARTVTEVLLPSMAFLLNDLGSRLSELGQREAALEVTREAVERYRQLAESRPDAFLPYLGMSLNNLGVMLRELGQREAALEATREAVEKYRQLAEERPQAYLPELAGSLDNLGLVLSGLGERAAALDAYREAERLYTPLAGEDPPRFEHELRVVRHRLEVVGRRRMKRVGHT